MNVSDEQTFNDWATADWQSFDGLNGVSFVSLAEPVADGSIHRARLAKGTKIPAHVHPASEYVYVVSGTIETGGRRCVTGTFWSVPANVKQGPHVAISDVEILTIRLGPLGKFEDELS